MKASPNSRRVTLLLCVAALLVLVTTPAFAVYTDPVPGDPIVAGIHLGGLSETDARTALAAVSVPALAPVPVTASGSSFTFDPTPAVRVDFDAIIDAAYAPSAEPTRDVAPVYAVDRATIDAWVAGVAAQVDKAPVNARYVPGAKRLYLNAAATGLKADVAAGSAALYAAVVAEVAAGGAAQATVVIPVNVVNPVITGDTHGRVIMVILRERRLLLYRNGKVERAYRTAVGMKRWPTPAGTFRVVRKVRMPSWSNPGSSWARSMPRYIKPGPNNPLGTRALYLNASGIRIHGTSNIRSIGTAASHGCVRLVRKDIEALFQLVPVGTQVFIVK
ncbi:MAG TPA: L,D-transpeptidase [Coriobacteriia bacterium]